MPEWVLERGIGETRVAFVEDGEILEARVRRDAVVPAGTILNAKLVAVAPRVTVEAGGEQFLLPRGVQGVSEGRELRVEVTREALGGSEPWKRGLARVTDEAVRASPLLAEGKFGTIDRWDDLVAEARDGVITFDGGELRIERTAAMTTIDVDGWLIQAKLAQMAAWAAARAIRRLDLAGSIGIDFPTLKGRDERQAIDKILDDYLPEPFERTAMNGFGFVQIVRPKLRPSLIDLAADRASFEARALLRRAGREVGATCLAAHPAVIGVIGGHRDWLDQLSRQVGGAVSLRSDASLAMSAGYAERV